MEYCKLQLALNYVLLADYGKARPLLSTAGKVRRRWSAWKHPPPLISGHTNPSSLATHAGKVRRRRR